jgi:hypothetical protein
MLTKGIGFFPLQIDLVLFFDACRLADGAVCCGLRVALTIVPADMQDDFA